MRANPTQMIRLTLVLVAATLVACGGGGRVEPVTTPYELTIEERARKAQSMLRAGRSREAIAIMEEVLVDAPEDGRLHNLMGQVLFLAGRPEPSVDYFVRALELDEYLTDAHNYLGAVYNELGRLNDSEFHFRAALEDPTYPTPELVWLNLGLLYGGQGREKDAIDALRRSVEIDPKYYQAHFELALLLESSGRLGEAIREFKVAAPSYSKSGEYFYRLGLAHFRAGQMMEARQVLRRVADVAPGSPSSASADELLEMIQ